MKLFSGSSQLCTLFLLLDKDDDQACCMSNKKPKAFRPHKLDTQQQPGTRQFQWCISCAGPGMIVIVFFAMAFWSWRKWPDIQIDFGQQLYIPWQLASGKLLYKDIVILHGPLSQYFNAFWFKLFGPSLTVIIFLNLFILAGMTGMIYLAIRRFADSFTATVACVVLLTLFGFSQYVGVGNYNYVTPYTHEATHGMALTAVMIFALSHYFTRGGRLPCAASGLCLGLVLLTKVEVAVAATIVALIGFASACFIAPPSVSPKKREFAIFCAAALAPALGFFLYFLSYLTAGQALRAVGQGFLVLSNELTKTTFYMGILGLDHPGENFRRMLIIFLGVVIFILSASAVDLAIRRVTRSPGLIAIVLGAVSALTLYLNRNVVPWIDILRALPLTTALTLAVFVTLLKRHSHRVELWTTHFTDGFVEHFRPQLARQDGPKCSYLSLRLLSADARHPCTGHLPTLLDPQSFIRSVRVWHSFPVASNGCFSSSDLLSSRLVTKVLSIEGLRRWPRCRYNHHLWTQGTSSWVSHRFDTGVDRRKDFSRCDICRAARGDHAQLSIAENDNSALCKFHDTRNDRLWRDANA